MVTKDLKGALNWVPIMRKGVDFSGLPIEKNSVSSAQAYPKI